MNTIEQWFLNRIFQREVRQGYDHDVRIANLYALIRKAARREFFEDNEITLDDFLREQFESTQYANMYAPPPTRVDEMATRVYGIHWDKIKQHLADLQALTKNVDTRTNNTD